MQCCFSDAATTWLDLAISALRGTKSFSYKRFLAFLWASAVLSTVKKFYLLQIHKVFFFVQTQQAQLDVNLNSCLKFFKFCSHRVAPALATCAVRLCSSSSSSSDDQRSYQRANWKHALAGLLAGTGAVLAYGFHHHKVRMGGELWRLLLINFNCVCYSQIEWHQLDVFYLLYKQTTWKHDFNKFNTV